MTHPETGRKVLFVNRAFPRRCAASDDFPNRREMEPITISAAEPVEARARRVEAFARSRAAR